MGEKNRTTDSGAAWQDTSDISGRERQAIDARRLEDGADVYTLRSGGRSRWSSARGSWGKYDLKNTILWAGAGLSWGQFVYDEFILPKKKRTFVQIWIIIKALYPMYILNVYITYFVSELNLFPLRLSLAT